MIKRDLLLASSAASCRTCDIGFVEQLVCRKRDSIKNEGFPVVTPESIKSVVQLSSPSKRSKVSLDFSNKQNSVRLFTSGVENVESSRTILQNGAWILEEALDHISEQGLRDIVKKLGPPEYYSAMDSRRSHPHWTFRSLCRIIAGQQLSGTSAAAVWSKLLKLVDASNANPTRLSPDRILKIVEGGPIVMETDFRKPAGLSNAKARYIVDLANHFQKGNLSDEILLNGEYEDVRSRLLEVKGIGPWTCDMFFIYELHYSDILPLGDLGVRAGIAKFFNLKGSAANGKLCLKKDFNTMQNVMERFGPYRSLASYYMWKVIDTDF